MRNLRSTRVRHEADVFNHRRELDELRGALKILQEEIEEAEKEQASQTGWWAYMTSFMSPKEKSQRRSELERRRLDRRAAQAIKEKRLEQQTSELSGLEAKLRHVNEEIRKVQEQKDKEEMASWMEARKRAAMAQAAEEFRKAQEESRAYEAVRKAQAEAEAALLKKRQEEMKNKAAQEERTREEFAFSRARYGRWAEPGEKREREAESKKRAEKQEHARHKPEMAGTRQTRTVPTASTTCEHRVWWNQVDGAHCCSRCATTTTKFAFKCPGCKTVACASCRIVLRGTAKSAQQPGGKLTPKRDGGDKEPN